MQVIYADTLFAINLIVNYLILLACTKLCAVQVSRVRLGLGASVGAIYSVLTLILPFLRSPVIKISAGILMTITAFGGCRRILKIILTMFGISAAFAGLIYALMLMTDADIQGGSFVFISFRMLILSFGISYFIISIVFRRLTDVHTETVCVEVELNGRHAKFMALKDTGNSLTDPITGNPVIIAGVEAIEPLFVGEASVLSLSPLEIVSAMGEKYRFRIIPYNAVGVKSGMLAAFRPDTVRIEGKTAKDCLIAVSPNIISNGGAYSGLIGVDRY